ncbi:glycosyltransferase [Riemerella anatipestifer]|uniref:capsular polysaccharide synthesis protein n=1 Tax=Riemerella anatipestifer TaxID=34085 RepID=UPI0021D5F8FE|nr:capsular polysaccharide synthesis protein [Riemerella anatipestifer]MCU7596859.1 glycosyltransferase [Riemerella anatipestifer]MCW0493973.1 glycosyltransferase [Riemerella anatipestifer]MCW0501833.1 glycosyltransferase [Riemerella anatipestifer]
MMLFNTIALKLKKTFPDFYQKVLNIKQGRYNYTFSEDRYPDSFLSNHYQGDYKEQKAPEIIYCFWTGDNEMSENRKRGLETIEKNAGVPVKLITPKNLQEYVKADAPLHKGYELLSLVHRSDYLRCYFMHHYGGGYADIKPFEHSWKPAFNKLNSKRSKYIIGYPELLYGGITPVKHTFLPDKSIYRNYEKIKESEEKVFKDLSKHTPLLIGTCSFICKPNTPITKEWYEELHRRMDLAYDMLSEFIPDENIIYNEEDYPNEKDYPIPYFHLLGQIIHPLMLKYHKHLLRDKKLLPILKNYR